MRCAVARASVERALRCVRIMHLVCCVGESVCATSHLLNVLPGRVAAGVRNKPEMHLLAKRCKESMEGHEKQN